MTEHGTFEERRQKTIWERLDEVDSAAAAGHQRLRKTLDQLEAHVDSLAERQAELSERIRAVTEAPVDAMKLMLSTKAIVSLIFGMLLIAGSYWNLSKKVDDQQKDAATTAKLQEAQMATLRDAANDAKSTAADAKRQYELLRYEFQDLKETVLKRK